MGVELISAQLDLFIYFILFFAKLHKRFQWYLIVASSARSLREPFHVGVSVM